MVAQARLWPCPAAYQQGRGPQAAHPLASLSDPRNQTTDSQEVSTEQSSNAHDKPLGALSLPRAQSTDSSSGDIWQASQVALLKIYSCPCQSTGPSLPHPYSEMNSCCPGHFISSSYPWLVVSSWGQAPENHLPASLSPGASSFQTQETVMRKGTWEHTQLDQLCSSV